MNHNTRFSRRQFLKSTAAAALLCGPLAQSRGVDAPAQPAFAPPVALFDKILHQVKLSLEDSAALVGEVGLVGVDCAVRPNDQIEPGRVKEDLPRYQALLGKHGCKVLLLTTAIQKPDSPNAADVLETARRLGVRFYRIGFNRLARDIPPARQLADLKAQLRDLAAWNKDLGLCALVQNHSPSGNSRYLGGDLNEMEELMRDLPPAQVGVAFDLGHALIVHGDAWSEHFERLKPHIRVAYVKDADRQRRFVRFGTGEFARTDFFSRLRQMGYAAPLSLHIEYDWAAGGEANRATLARALRESLGVLRQWLAAA